MLRLFTFRPRTTKVSFCKTNIYKICSLSVCYDHRRDCRVYESHAFIEKTGQWPFRKALLWLNASILSLQIWLWFHILIQEIKITIRQFCHTSHDGPDTVAKWYCNINQKTYLFFFTKKRTLQSMTLGCSFLILHFRKFIFHTSALVLKAC